jgi:hypothetical protein
MRKHDFFYFVAFVTSTTVRSPTTKSQIIADEYEDLYPDQAEKKNEHENAKTIIQNFNVTSNIQFR